MKAFLTGASGFIGSHLMSEFHQKKWDLGVLSHRRTLPPTIRYQAVHADVTDDAALKKALEGYEIVFHMAAALGGSLIKKSEFFRINVQGTQALFEAAKSAGVKRVIHFSSAGVLGAVKKNEIADETYTRRPLTAYDKSKQQGEDIALDFANQGLQVVVIRPGWVYGPGDRRTFKLIKAIAHKRFLLVAKGRAWQTPIYIKDLIDGILLSADKGKSGEIYHLAGNEVLTVQQMTETIADITESKIFPISLPSIPSKMAAWVMEKGFRLFHKEAPLTPGKLAFFLHPKPLAIHKAQEQLGFSPKTDFYSGMESTVAWYRQHEWL